MPTTEQKPDFSNPYNPATMAYVDAFLKECEKQIHELVAMHRMMEQAQEKRLQEDVALQVLQMKAEEEKQQFTSQIEANNRVIENEIKEQANPNETVLNNLKSDISAEISKLEVELNNLKYDIDSIKSKIPTTTKEVSKDLQERRVKVDKVVTDTIEAAIKNNDEEFVIRDDKGTELTNEQKQEFVDRLKETPPAPSLEEKFAKSQEYRENLIELLKQDREGDTLKQIARKEDLFAQIRQFAELGGGDVTPSQLLALVQKNMALNNLYAKLSDKKLDLDVDDLKKLSDLYKDLTSKEKTFASTKEKIDEMTKQIHEIDTILGKAQPKEERSEAPSPGSS